LIERALLGFVATHSFANGLAYWLIALVRIALVRAPEGRSKVAALLAWVTCSALAIGSFFCGYHFQEQDFQRPFTDPVDLIGYLLAYLGSPVWSLNVEGAISAGAAGTLAFAVAAIQAIRGQADRRDKALSWLCLGLYAGTGALLTAAGRGDLGVLQALDSRYATFGNLLWIAIVVLWSLRLAEVRGEDRSVSGVSLRWSAACATSLLLLCLLFGDYRGMLSGSLNSRLVRSAGQRIAATYPAVNPRDIAVLNSDRPAYARKMLTVLERHRLSMFRD
jgi:hypothetical protein